jgi:Recombinase zinc beta ribbon domain
MLQGIIICGRCGRRMTLRYHTRGTRQVPTYACQRDDIENADPFCAIIPGHTLDQHVGQLLIDTLTPLAVEAALQVSAELQQRAADACAEIAGILRRRGLPNGVGRPFTPVMVQRVIRTYKLRSRRQRLADTGLIPLSQMARLLGVSTATVKDWYHAAEARDAHRQLLLVPQPLPDRRLRHPRFQLLHDVIPVHRDRRPGHLPQRHIRQLREPSRTSSPHRSSLTGGPPGTIPAPIAGVTYFLTVLRSTSRLSPLWTPPAC